MATAKRLPSGMWRVQLYVGTDATKKRNYKSFTAETKREAEYAAAEYNRTRIDTAPSIKMTLQQAYERYIAAKTNVLSPSTVREYKLCVNRDFAELMPLRLMDLTYDRIQSAVNVYASTRAPKTVRNAHALLSSVLAMYAPHLHLSTRLPQRTKKEITIPEEKDVQALLRASEGKPMHIAIILGAIGTLRRSEVCALTDADVLDSGVLVNKAMVLNPAGEWVVKTTKTVAGTRFVEMPEDAMRKMRGIDGRLYPNAPSTLTNKFKLLCNSTLGRTYRFHDLRHYSASTLHALGVPDAYIMKRGGWENRDVLDKIYTHVLTQDQITFNERITSHFAAMMSTQNSGTMQHEMQHE